jgi:hypothetical protein
LPQVLHEGFCTKGAALRVRGTRVIWFYAKHGRHLRCEVRQLVDGDHFDLVITDADGTERVEHFHDSSALTHRSRQLEAEWVKDGWEGPFGREY